ncbi:MAG: phosphoribosylglycinamide formyltransferase [Rikenellaceae bacterium]|nr:phosphoribosylglycinamide formyltransferase [Rikenellaceae bacterium]
MSTKPKIAIFASGYGSNFEAIARATLCGEIDAEVALLVCDKPSARVVEVARELDIRSFVFSARDFSSKAEYEARIVEQLVAAKVELVCLAGYMRIVGETLLKAYAGRIINLHPSLLPSFKGAHAIKDALEYGVKVFGATIHYVDETLDGGKIIAQQAIAYDGNDLNEVTQMIHAVEHRLYIDTIKKLLKPEK